MFVSAINVMSLNNILVKIIFCCINKSKPKKIKHIDLSCNDQFLHCRLPSNILKVFLRDMKLCNSFNLSNITF